MHVAMKLENDVGESWLDVLRTAFCTLGIVHEVGAIGGVARNCSDKPVAFAIHDVKYATLTYPSVVTLVDLS